MNRAFRLQPAPSGANHGVMNIADIEHVSDQRDKRLHFAVGAAIGAAGAVMAYEYAPLGQVLFGTALSAAAGVGKEGVDSVRSRLGEEGTVDQMDAWATVAGGAIGALVGMLIIRVL